MPTHASTAFTLLPAGLAEHSAEMLRTALAVAGIAALMAGSTVPAGAQGATSAHIAATIDSLAQAALATRQLAGLTIAVVRGRDTLVLKGYGSADLELGVPTPVGAIYEIGSATKQFTAAAILQLAEQAKLSLDDPVTQYVPNFPDRGARITLRHLLDHTAGLFDYVALNGFIRRARLRITPDSLVDLFAAEPRTFAPGHAMAYSNSGYVLLGLVIERVSGQSYANYVREHLFALAGMSTSHVCSTEAVIPGTVHGYDVDEGRLEHAPYIDFSWSFGAGSLCASARDLVAWQRALHGGRILGPQAYGALITPDTLVDGARLRYAKGVAVDSILGHRAIHHGGDIPGFAAELTYLPDDSLQVVVLMNSEGPVRPDALTREIIRAVAGDRSPPAQPLRGRAANYAGDYIDASGTRHFRIAVDASGKGLMVQSRGGTMRPLTCVGGDTFAHGDQRYRFGRVRGRISTLLVDDVYEAIPTVRRPLSPK